MSREVTNLENTPKLFAPRYGCRSVDNSGDALEGVGEIALNEVFDDDDVDLVAVLGVRLPQRISLSGPHDSDEVFSAMISRITADLLTLERGTLLSGGVPKRANQCIRTRQ